MTCRMASDNIYVTESGEKLEITYDVNDDFDPRQVSIEERYRMRNIPFFLIPPSETLAYDPTKVKSKINTRNLSYKPSRLKSPDEKPRPRTSDGIPSRYRKPPHPAATARDTINGSSIHYTRKTDWREPRMVQPVEKRRSTIASPMSQKELTNKALNDRYLESVKRRNTMPAPLSPRARRKKEVSERSPLSTASSPVRGVSQPRGAGGCVKSDVDRTSRAVVDAENKKPVRNPATREGDRDSTGAVMENPEVDKTSSGSKVVHSISNTRDHTAVNSRGVTTSSKPGALSREASDQDQAKSPLGRGLTFEESPRKKIPSYKVSSYANVKSKIDRSDPNPAHKLQREVKDLIIEEGREINPRFAKTRPRYHRKDTVGGALEGFPHSSNHRQNPLTRYRLQKAASLDSSPCNNKKDTPSELPSFSKFSFAKKQSRPRRMQSAVEGAIQPTFEDIEEDDCAPVDSEMDSRRPIRCKAFADDSLCNNTPSSSSSPPPGDESNICGMEVTNSSTETTVVLQHILALNSSNRSSSNQVSDMTIIEEDESEEEYYESESISSASAPAETLTLLYKLPHLIPKLVVTDELEGLVETVVEAARELKTVDKGAQVMDSTSNRPNSVSIPIVEEEEEEGDEEYPLTKM